MAGAKRMDILKILTGLSRRFRDDHSGISQLGDTTLDKEDRAIEDLVAIADLSAGSLLEAVNASGLSSSRVSQVRDVNDAVRERCKLLLRWRDTGEGTLRHHCTAFMSNQAGIWSIRNLAALQI